MGEKVRQGGEKAKNLRRSLMTYHKYMETAGDVLFARRGRDIVPRAREIFDIIERVLKQQLR